MSTDDMILS